MSTVSKTRGGSASAAPGGPPSTARLDPPATPAVDSPARPRSGEGRVPPRIVALGGGHGLFTMLTALRRVTSDLTAVVTVADDGGSSGRIRREFDVLPPGDLRMALAALSGDAAQDQHWAELYQHRLGGSGVLAGHPVGNLVLTGLFERLDDPVAALDFAGRSLGAVGRVLPMSEVPLDLVATVEPHDRDDPIRGRRIRGQSAIASSPGRVREIAIRPADAPACPAALDAVRGADVVVLGPGSWFTSVLPHLLLPQLARALVETHARVIVTLNLVPQPGETDGFSAAEHLRVLRRYCRDLRIDAVIADRPHRASESDAGSRVGSGDHGSGDHGSGDHGSGDHGDDGGGNGRADGGPDLDLARVAAELGAELVLGDLCEPGRDDRHHPDALADAVRRALAPPVAAARRPDQGLRNDVARAVPTRSGPASAGGALLGPSHP